MKLQFITDNWRWDNFLDQRGFWKDNCDHYRDAEGMYYDDFEVEDEFAEWLAGNE